MVEIDKPECTKPKCHEVNWAVEELWPQLWYRHYFVNGKCVDCDESDRRINDRE